MGANQKAWYQNLQESPKPQEWRLLQEHFNAHGVRMTFYLKFKHLNMGENEMVDLE